MNDEWLKDTLKRHDERLQRHSERIDKLENTQYEMAVKIENLCDTIDKLASNLNKLTYAIITALVSFFFYAIQNNLFN